MSNPKRKKKGIGNGLLSDIFPSIDEELIGRLMIDAESVHYISTKKQASAISKIITTKLTGMELNPSELSIVDCASGVGGNTLSFASLFNKVYSIEIDKHGFDCLMNNVDLYGFTNVTVINENCVDIIGRFRKCDVVFIDPPWGGKKYKLCKKLRLTLSKVPIEDICNNLMNKNMMASVPKLIVLKLPTNYDHEHLFSSIRNGGLAKSMERRTIGKIDIIVIENLSL